MNKQASRILVVDDEPHIRDLLVRFLTMDGYECLDAEDGGAALELMKSNTFELVISDIMMPGFSGLELLRKIKASHPDVAVIMVTAVDSKQTAIEAIQSGAYDYLIKPFDRTEVLITVANALERRRLTLLSQEYERSLEAQVEERTKEVLQKAQQVKERETEIVFRLLSSMGWRDDETGEHAERIGTYSAVLAEKLGWDIEAADNMRLAAPMHDIGKIGIPDSILRKRGPLTPEEFEVMKQHTVIGGRILDGSDVSLIQLARNIALHHHEKWDGSGYPFGLSGADIPECGRIVGIVDVYDALVNDRVYRRALKEKEAIQIMKRGRGKHFDPKIFDVFLGLLPQMRNIREDSLRRENSKECDRNTPDGLISCGENYVRARLAS